MLIIKNGILQKPDTVEAKLQEPIFQPAELGEIPTYRTDAIQSPFYYGRIKEQKPATAGDARDLMHAAGGMQFYSPFEKFYNLQIAAEGLPAKGGSKEDIGVQRFEYFKNDADKDMSHAFAHISGSGLSHSMSGEMALYIKELVYYGPLFRNKYHKNADMRSNSSFDISDFKENLEFFQSHSINALYAKEYVKGELPKYELMPKIATNEHGQIDLSKNPYILNQILEAAMVNANVEEKTGKAVGHHTGKELTALPYEYSQFSKQDMTELGILRCFNMIPDTKMNLDMIQHLSPKAQKVQSYVEMLKESAEKPYKEKGMTNYLG